jgi:hypothetical protein
MRWRHLACSQEEKRDGEPALGEQLASRAEIALEVEQTYSAVSVEQPVPLTVVHLA